MAFYKGQFLSGAIGPVVTYGFNGKQCIKTRGSRIRQTKATKASANDFGKIKQISAMLRMGLSPIVPDYTARPVMYAVDGVVSNWYRECLPGLTTTAMNFPHFSPLVLNKEALPLPMTYLGMIPEADWNGSQKVSLHIPSIDTTAVLLPKNATAVSFTLMVTGSSLDYPRYHGHPKKLSVETNINAGSIGPVDLFLDFPQVNGILYLAVLQLRYKDGDGWVEEEKWKPLLVVGSCYRI